MEAPHKAVAYGHQKGMPGRGLLAIHGQFVNAGAQSDPVCTLAEESDGWDTTEEGEPVVKVFLESAHHDDGSDDLVFWFRG